MEQQRQESGSGGQHNAAQQRLSRFKEKFLPGIKITLLISLIFYLAMLIVGCLGVNKCSANENIPLFLIVIGVIGLLSKLITVIKEKVNPFFEARYLESSLYTIELAFTIIGSYWVYKVYGYVTYNPSDRYYCQKTVYLFAFLYLTIMYALMLAMLAGFLCFLFCICFLKKIESEEMDPEAQTYIQQEEDGREARGKDYGTSTTTESEKKQPTAGQESEK